LIGFSLPALFTIVLVIIEYLIGPISDETDHRLDHKLLNNLWKKSKSRPDPEWSAAIQNSVLAYSDQALLTGIAILISAFAQLNRGISSYHWQLAVYLAWFSSLIHLATITLLRDFFRQHKTKRNWRLAFMFVLIGFLIVALIPTGANLWLNKPDEKARDFFSISDQLDYKSSLNSFPALTSILTLIFSIAVRGIKLFEPSSRLFRKWLRLKPESKLKAWIDKVWERAQKRKEKSLSLYGFIALHEYLLASFYIWVACLNLFESVLWEVSDPLLREYDSLSNELLAFFNFFRFLGLFLPRYGALNIYSSPESVTTIYQKRINGDLDNALLLSWYFCRFLQPTSFFQVC
jgi:hypothetical protein